LTNYLIYQCSSGTGLGHNLFSIDRCAGFALATGRRLALDFRRFQYFPRDAHSQFFNLCRPSTRGAPEVTVDLDEIDEIYAIPDRRVLASGSLSLDIERDFPERAVLVFGGFCDLVGAEVDGRRSNLTMAPLSPLREMVTETILRAFGGRKVVGIHFRHGNGEIWHGRPGSGDITFPFVYDLIKREYVTRATELVSELGVDQTVVLVTSDNADFISDVASRVPNPVVLSKVVPDQAYQRFIRAHGHDFAILRDAIVDMSALAHCDKLVCGNSGFSMAAILHNSKLGPDDIMEVRYARPEVIDRLVPLALRIRETELKVAASGNLAVWEDLVSLYKRADRTEDAAKVEQAIAPFKRSRENPRCCAELIETLCASGDREAAIAAAERGLSWNPEDSQLQATLGHLLSEVGKSSEAVEHLEQACRLQSPSITDLEHLASAQWRAGAILGAVRTMMRKAALVAGRQSSRKTRNAGQVRL
jgi:hypothetical protein